MDFHLVPRELPDVRRRLVEWWNSPEGWRTQEFTHVEGLSILGKVPAFRREKVIAQTINEEVSRLRGELFYVNDEMTQLAAGQRFQYLALQPQDLPAPVGFIYFDRTLGTYSEESRTLHVRGISWGPYVLHGVVEGIWLSFYATYDTPEGVPFLYDTETFWPFSDGDTRMADAAGERASWLSAALGAWLFMGVHKEAEIRDEQLPSAIRRRMARAEMPVDPVRVVTLRKLRPTERDEEKRDGSSGGNFSHRWYSRGYFWEKRRNKNGERIYCSGSIKGPEDKPLIIKETVNVWRR
jgi:hypothetical protein